MAGMKWWWKRLPTDQTWWTHGHILEIRNTQSPRSTPRAKWEEVPLLWGGPSGSSLKDCPDFLLYFLLRFKLVFHGFHKYFSRRRRNLPIFWFFFLFRFSSPIELTESFQSMSSVMEIYLSVVTGQLHVKWHDIWYQIKPTSTVIGSHHRKSISASFNRKSNDEGGQFKSKQNTTHQHQVGVKLSLRVLKQTIK